MSNNDNNKQQLDPESLLVFDKAQAPSTTTVNVGDVDLGFPEINHVAAAPQNLVQSAEAPPTTTPTVNKLDHDGISLVERRSTDVKPREKNESLGISGINQPEDISDDETIGFLLDCAKKGENLGKQRPSICKVSRILRDLSKSSFHPQLVSIGPIHREDPKLQEFERQKACYLNDLLNRCYDSTPKETLEACLQKVNNLMPQIRESYAGVIENYSDVELAWMMVMDGCFILEFCFKHEDEDLYLPNKMQNKRIAMDLMLLENQVPFVVLQALLDCSMGKGSLFDYLVPYYPRPRTYWRRTLRLSQFLYYYLAPYIKLFREKISTHDHVDSDSTHYHVDSDSTHDHVDSDSTHNHVDSDSTPAHVLGYLHKLYHLEAAKSSEPKYTESWNRIMDEAFHSIVELDRYGMNFKPHQEDEWSMTIKYQSATLLMPTLVIHDTTELILRNFIAYEQSFPQNHNYFTSYAHVMNKLIDSKEDIAKLVESKVLVNNLGSNQEAADMINKICKNISITDFCYTQEFTQMDNYYNGFWPKNVIAKLRGVSEDPFLGTKIIVFFLTVVQTIYTIKAK